MDLIQAECRHGTSRTDSHQECAYRGTLGECQVALRVAVETQPSRHRDREADQYQFPYPKFEHRTTLAAFQWKFHALPPSLHKTWANTGLECVQVTSRKLFLKPIELQVLFALGNPIAPPLAQLCHGILSMT